MQQKQRMAGWAGKIGPVFQERIRVNVLIQSNHDERTTE